MQRNSFKLRSEERNLTPRIPRAATRLHYFACRIVLLALVALYFPTRPEAESLPDQEDQQNQAKTIRIQALMQTSALGDAAVTSIYRDSIGRLWVSEQNGLHMHNGQRLISFSTRPSKNYFAPSLDISSITEDDRQIIWISSRSAGISRYNERRRSFEEVENLPASAVSDLAFVDPGILLYLHLGVLKAYRIQAELHIDNFHERLGAPRNISKIDLIGKLLLMAFTDSGTVTLDLNNLTMSDYDLQLKRQNDSSLELRPGLGKIKQPALSHAEFDLENVDLQPASKGGFRGVLERFSVTAVYGGLLFAGSDDGLYVFHRDGKLLGKYDSKNSGLTNSHITYLHPDKNTLWIGTYEGLCFLEFSSFEIYDNSSDGISNEILAFSQDYYGKVWLGTYHGVYRFDPSTKSHTPLIAIFPELELVDDRVMTIDATGHEIFLGTRGSGILIFDSISGKMGRHTIQNNDHLEVTSVLTQSLHKFR